MNFFSKSKSTPASNQAEIDLMETMQKLEIEMMTDMYSKLSDVCREKCVGVEIKEAELTKGEAVCLDRSSNSIRFSLKYLHIQKNQRMVFPKFLLFLHEELVVVLLLVLIVSGMFS